MRTSSDCNIEVMRTVKMSENNDQRKTQEKQTVFKPAQGSSAQSESSDYVQMKSKPESQPTANVDTISNGPTRRSFKQTVCNSWRKLVDELLGRSEAEDGFRKQEMKARAWAVREAVKRDKIALHIYNLLPRYLQDVALSEAVSSGLWHIVSSVVEGLATGPEVQRGYGWAVAEAMKHANGKDLHNILYHCEDDQLDVAIDEAVTRGMWRTLQTLLTRDVSNAQVQHAVMESIKYAEDSGFLSDLIQSKFNKLTLEAVLGELVMRHRWSVVEDLLQSRNTAQLVENALINITNTVDVHVASAIENANQISAWISVCFMLQHWVSGDETYELDVSDVCEPSFDARFCNDHFALIVRHCARGQLVLALEAAIRRNLPRTALDVLVRLGQQENPPTATAVDEPVPDLVLEMESERRKLVAECIKMGMVFCSCKPPPRPPRDRPGFPSPPPIPPRGGRTYRYMSHARAARIGLFNLFPLQQCSNFHRLVEEKELDLVRMLYESCTCASHDAYTLHRDLTLWALLRDAKPLREFLRDKAINPRSLMSACRLVISRNLGVGKREEKVKQLPIPEPLRDYILFCDIISEVKASSPLLFGAFPPTGGARASVCRVCSKTSGFLNDCWYV